MAEKENLLVPRLSRGMRIHIRRELARVRLEKHDSGIDRRNLGNYVDLTGVNSSKPTTDMHNWCDIGLKSCKDYSNPYKVLDACPTCPEYIEFQKADVF